MPVPFSADEIFEMAEQIERNGARFYQAAGDRAGEHPARRRLLVDLAEWERQHERTFAEMRSQFAAEGGTTVEPGTDADLYLRALAEGRVFDPKADPSRKLTGKETIQDILGKAIVLEKDSIIFYLGMRDMVSQRQGRQRVEEIIREEMRHITMLDAELASLVAP